MSVELIRRLSPDSLSIMEFTSDTDVQIAEKMLRFPLLGEDVLGKWKISFGYDLHMTQHSRFFHKERKPQMLPVYEGKMIHQFTHQWEGGKPRYWVDEKDGRQAIIGVRLQDSGQNLDYRHYRVAYRAIARNTDSRTMIASMIPRNVFCGNSLLGSWLFSESGDCLVLPTQLLACMCMLNSFTVDHYLRQMVSANINMFYVYQLPVPRLAMGDPSFNELVIRAAKLICTTPEFDDLAKEVGLGSHKNGVTDEVGRAKLRAEIDGMVAHLYGLTESEFTHILSTFPLVAEPVKAAALEAYRDVEKGLIK